MDKYRKCSILVVEISCRKKGTEELFEIIMTLNSPTLMSDTKPQLQEGSSEDTKENKLSKNLHLGILSSNYRKSKIKS